MASVQSFSTSPLGKHPSLDTRKASYLTFGYKAWTPLRGVGTGKLGIGLC